jgi:hypothetical protein
MMHRKHGKHKTKEILVLTLKSLMVGEGFFCTKRTYDNIRDRVEDFKRTRTKEKYGSRPWGAVVNVRRVA